MDTLIDLRTRLDTKIRECERLEQDNRYLKDALDMSRRQYLREIVHLEDRFSYRADELLTVHEFAKLARMSRRALDRLKQKRPDFPQARVLSGRHLYVKTEVLDWIMRQTV